MGQLRNKRGVANTLFPIENQLNNVFTTMFAGFLGRALKLALAGALLLATSLGSEALAYTDLSQITLPPGFHIELFTDQTPNAREMALGGFHGGKGVVYVGSFERGNVYALEISSNHVTRVDVIAQRLELPIGVAWRDDTLYVSAVSRIIKFEHIDEHLNDPPQPVVVTDKLPSETHHGGKFLAFSKDGWLYVPVGAPCNVCKRDENQYGILERMRPDFSPSDGSLWFTDNGRDNMGDELPSDKLNHLTHPIENFGFPYCHQGDLPDPEFGAQKPCSEFVPPMAKLGAHVATLGMRFYTGTMFPKEYRGNIFVAEHGSWNRSKKIGYRVARVVLSPSGSSVQSTDVFAQGWLQVDPDGREHVSGRPDDVLVMPDGALLVSDDTAGAIYRITYSPP
jgi:glucose/arabinose dehydrogenase